MLPRRRFLQLLSTGLASRIALAAAGPRSAPSSPPKNSRRTIATVTGPLPADDLGLTLVHEHVLVDFIGASEVHPGRYDRDAVFEQVLPHLRAAAAAGVRSIFECTPMFLGRDPELLRRLSLASGVRLITNTGLYGAREGLFLPAYASEESAAQLARRWIAESREGIDSTGIRPGFIKCGVNPAPVLSALDRKLVEAAARTHAETGLAIAVHTGRGPGHEQMALLRDFAVPARAFIWVHAASATDDALVAAAATGAWLSFDSVRPPTLARHVQLCTLFKQRGHLDQILVSHDAGWYDPAKPGGGSFVPYTGMFSSLLPALRQAGFSEADLHQLLVVNPTNAFAVPSS